jgi:hypothetical protein
MIKITLTWAFLLLTINSLVAQNTPTTAIKWPTNYEPARSKFYVENQIEINASPERVWAELIDALRWESYYTGAQGVSLEDTTQRTLQANSVLNWKTMGLQFRSTVKEYEPNRLLAWESVKKSIQGYHVWLIEPTPTGCRVITAESQNGWLTFLEKTFQGKKLKQLHDVWLAGLKQRAEAPARPAATNVPSLTPAERTEMTRLLTESLALFNQTVANLSPAQLAFRPKPGSWTLAECIEHVTLAELRFPEIVTEAMQQPANPAFRRKIKITDEAIRPRMTSRSWRAKSPEVFWPTGQFLDANRAVERLKEQRAKTLTYVGQTTDDLRHHYWRHPLTGHIDLYQTLLLMSAHLERHTAQMERIKADEAFPKL